jgi:hypothetical protein
VVDLLNVTENKSLLAIYAQELGIGEDEIL